MEKSEDKQPTPVIMERTSEHYKTDSDLPGRFEHPEWFKGYNTTDPHPIYRTSNMVYGSRSPSVHNVPTTFQPRSQKFSTHLGYCGMYKNNSLNTYIEKSTVTGPDNSGLTKMNRLNYHNSYSANPNI